MATIDTDPWLAPLSDSDPAGPDLEFDDDFGALDRASQGKPEQQYGDTIIPAEEPDWKEVDGLARGLLDRSRDLRVLGHLAVSRLRLGGLPDYAAMLGLARALLEQRWDDLHPRLDPEDDNDPTLRANALLRVGHPAWVLRYLRDMPLAQSPRMGRFSWRDAAVATGAVPSTAKDKPSESTIRAAFQDTDPARLAELREAAAAAGAAIRGIDAAFDAKAGSGSGPDFEELGKVLHEIARTIERYAPAPAEAAEAAAAEEDGQAVSAGEAQGGPAVTTSGRAQAVTAAALTEVTSRADAVRLLDLICEYYRKWEPSSPLPLLLERARRLADLPFLDILKDLAPDGLGQARIMTGAQDE